MPRALTIDDLLSLRTFSPRHQVALSPDGWFAAWALHVAGGPGRMWRVRGGDLDGCGGVRRAQ